MTHAIMATEDGISLFNAVAIGLGFEILKNNIRQDSEGAKLLLEEFGKHHPKFDPKTWEELVKWLAVYNNSKDMERVLAPVLFKLNQKFQQDLDSQILDELTNLVWENKERIAKNEPWFQLTKEVGSIVLFPRIENLPLAERNKVLQSLKEIFSESSQDELSSRAELRKFLETEDKAKKLLASLKAAIQADKDASKRAFNVGELRGMSNALGFNIVDPENRTFGVSHTNKINLYLTRKPTHWDVNCEEAFEGVLNVSPTILKVSMPQVFSPQAPQIDPPTPQQLDELRTPRILFTEEIVDNPGRGNCAFYAFAIGLINIIQEENSYKNRSKFNEWVGLDSSIASDYEAICKFSLKPGSRLTEDEDALLGRLQRSLRNVAYTGKLADLRRACARSSAEVIVEGISKNTKQYKDAMMMKYRHIIATSMYADFANIFFGNHADLGYGVSTFSDSAAVRMALAEVNRSSVEVDYEALVLVPLFLKLIYGPDKADQPITSETEPSMSSPILASMSKVKQEFYWGTQQDLNFLAVQLKVNLRTLRDGAEIHQ